MQTCEACGRDFRRRTRSSWTCPYCGYNTNPNSPLPREGVWVEQRTDEDEERERQRVQQGNDARDRQEYQREHAG